MQASRKKLDASVDKPFYHRVLREGALLFFSALAIYMFLSLATYQVSDPGWSHSVTTDNIRNSGGVFGAWFADIFLFLFGYFAYLFPFMVGYGGWLVYRSNTQKIVSNYFQWSLVAAGFILTLAAGTALSTLHFAAQGGGLLASTGGILGDVVSRLLVFPFSFIGATLFLLVLFLTGVSLVTGISWMVVTEVVGRQTVIVLSRLNTQIRKMREEWALRKVRKAREDKARTRKIQTKPRITPRIEPVIKTINQGERVQKEKQVELFASPTIEGLPPISLLDVAEAPKHSVSPAALEAISRQVEIKLQDFGIEVQVVAVCPGPVVTRYELKPAAGVKVSQISGLAKDLARSLSAISVRIVDVIPGKSVIGLEIPNENREMVRLSEILSSHDYEKSTSPMTLGLGKDISGKPVVVDLAKMPHLLVAGTTGSGKSVAINAMILSMLYNATPKEMRMIMIDPKMLELSIYEGIPHLLAPVVTDMKEAANSLRWCVAEMERRYALMSALGVRNIANYNRKVKEAIDSGNPIADPLVKIESLDGEDAPTLDTLPYIVVIIDELADMMMVVGKKVEVLIARLAQKARASGIHLILATQRPSVDVITGLIKSNIPTRIAFQVSSKIDSRTILDQMGAEQLLGHGDMLYLPPGTAVPTRIHGAFVDDHEVHNVTQELKKHGEAEYVDEILNPSFEGEGDMGFGAPADDTDALYDQAVRIVTETRKASISGVQRRLKIGYNRAARMVEEMERTGVVGPLESNGMREVIAPPPASDR